MENRKNLKIYIGIAVWAMLLCGMVAFWLTESILILQGRKNDTSPAARLVQVNTILDTMMMDQVHNTTFENTLHFPRNDSKFPNIIKTFKVPVKPTTSAPRIFEPEGIKVDNLLVLNTTEVMLFL